MLGFFTKRESLVIGTLKSKISEEKKKIRTKKGSKDKEIKAKE